MIVQALSVAYGSAATLRRQWYARPGRARRLAQPVVSIGNLSVGGSGKTPATATIARVLLAAGEQPVVLSRGYGRRVNAPGVTVVSDRTSVRADLAHAGDEPLLLARLLPGVPVLVCPDRFEAGREAERTHGATVHLLDDGFQHVRLARDVDVLLLSEQDLHDRVLPAGRLREPVANAGCAHAAIVPGASPEQARALAARAGLTTAFGAQRVLDAPRPVGGAAGSPGAGARVLALAGIARPERFFDDLRTAGYCLLGTRVFADHHAFTAADLASVVESARAAGADVVLTTEKDAVRLEGLTPSALPFFAVPLALRVDPADAFRDWLAARLAAARQERG